MVYQAYEPIDPRDAFTVAPRPGTRYGRSAAASQAAMLLALRAGVLGSTLEVEKWGRGRKKEFSIPSLEPLKRKRRMRLDEATECLGVSPRELRQEKRPDLQDEIRKTVSSLYRKPTIESAAGLFEAAMYSPYPLVAVAAAAGARETTRLRPLIRQTLEDGAESDDRLTARLAQAALSYIDPDDPVVSKRVVPPPASRKRPRKSRTAVVTHGTFATDKPWYQPGGDFYEALKQRRPDLHVHDRSFRWSGGYSRSARRADAVLLQQWLGDQGLGEPDFFAHSHGGTVAHLATGLGARFDRLVLMGWPVHEAWFPRFSNVRRIIDVRVRLDLVILLDRGGQRFRTDQFDVEEHRHGWFDHSSTHESDYWDRHDLWGAL